MAVVQPAEHLMPAEPQAEDGPETSDGLVSMESIFELPVMLGTKWVDAEVRLYLARRIAFVARPPAD
jgi:hypothetical protein